MTKETTFSEVEVHQARSVAFRLLASAFRYPDKSLLERLRDPNSWQEWPARLRQIDPELESRLDDLRRCAFSAETYETLEDCFVQLFGHAVRGACPPYELEYGPGEIIQLSSSMADIAGFYSAFGLELTDKGNERPDHLVVECEFLAVLAAKEAYAIENNDAEALAVLRDAKRKFLKDHLGRWFPSFARGLREKDTGAFYSRLADFAEALILAECRTFDITCEPPLLEPASAELPEETAMTCGVEDSCPGAGDPGPVQINLDSALDGRKQQT